MHKAQYAKRNGSFTPSRSVSNVRFLRLFSPNLPVFFSTSASAFATGDPGIFVKALGLVFRATGTLLTLPVQA